MQLTLLAIFLVSLLTAFTYDKYPKRTTAVIFVVLLAIVGYYSNFLPDITRGERIIHQLDWIDSLGIHLTFLLDGLSLFFVLLVLVFGIGIIVYAHKYMEGTPQSGRFMSYLLLFMVAMLGMVLSANLISLFVFWELTSLTSFLLIGFDHQREESRRAARQALLITAGGGLALMSGFIILDMIAGTGYQIVDLLNDPTVVRNSRFSTAIIILVAVGAISKSAQFPLHFWLPNAMAAPTPVSAYLHSATMVKAGVYLIFRLNPLFQDIALWHDLLGVTGALTMLLGAIKAFQEDDLKKILAYTTISALGIFFMMIGLGGEAAIHGAMVYVMAHALYKGALFLTVGSIDRQTGHRRLSQLSDLRQKMPLTAAAVLLSVASMAGVLPLLGFVGKELMYAALYEAESTSARLYFLLLFIAGAFFTAVAIAIFHRVFLQKGPLRNKPIRESSLLMSLPPLLLAGISLAAGLAPGTVVEPLLTWSAGDIQGAAPSMKLKLWHGFNEVFLLSMATLLVGVLLYKFGGALRKFRQPSWLRGDHFYEWMIGALQWIARFSTQVFQNGYLRNYITMVILAFSLLMGLAMVDGQLLRSMSWQDLYPGPQIYELVILAFVVIAVLYLFQVRSRLIVTATFGIIGYSIALAYTLFSAPDAAITQFLAETLTLILLILIIHRLPSYTLRKSIARIKYLPVAILFGGIMATTAFILLNQEKSSALQSYFLENSIPAGKGQNAVNVILVDFRALDTLGEITVLTVTMIGITALLRITSQPNQS